MSQTADSKSELFSEDTWFQGVLLTFVAYGSTVTLCIQCFFTFASTLTRAKLMSQLPLLAFVVAVFSLSTIFIGGADSIILAPAAIVDNPHLAQGPEYYEETHWTRHINIMTNSTLITLCILEDMLLVRVHSPKPHVTISKRNTALAMYGCISDFDSIALVQPGFGFRFLARRARCVLFHDKF